MRRDRLLCDKLDIVVRSRQPTFVGSWSTVTREQTMSILRSAPGVHASWTSEAPDRVTSAYRFRFRSSRLVPALLAVVSAALMWTKTATAQEEYPEPYPDQGAVQSQEAQGSYGYFRLVDGSATLMQSGTQERVKVQANEPFLVGDQVWLAVGSRAELVLADRNIVRLDGGTELVFTALANSSDRSDPSTVLDLRRGKLQLVVEEGFVGNDFPSILVPNASIRVRETGSYLIVVDGDRRTDVVVRRGRVEVLSASDGADVRTGEELLVEGANGSTMTFAQARGMDRLESWGAGLAYADDSGSQPYVASELQYAAAPMSNHGTWVSVGASWAWRPQVAVGWRPYWHGRWRHTPTGMIWVSYEPWGWVPYHYGTWDYVGGYGWCWFPGRRFAPSHVYWYWGPRHVGWVPHGYYWRHYRSHYGWGWGFNRGFYGYVGGNFGPFHFWVFTSHGRLGHHRQGYYSVRGYDLARREGTLPRGILTSDTRGFTPERWRNYGAIERVATLDENGRRRSGIPDVNSFVNRVPRLPREVERVALVDPAARRVGERRPAAGENGRLEPVSPDRGRAGSGLSTGNSGRESAALDRRVLKTPERVGQETGALRRPETAGRTPTRSPAGQTEARQSQTRPVNPRQTEVRQPELRRPTPGSPQARTAMPDRAGRQGELRRPDSPRASPVRPETGRAGERQPAAERQLKRPEATQRRTSNPTVRRPATGQPATRRPTTSQPATGRPQVRRPEQALPQSRVTRPSNPTSSRRSPTVRSGNPSAGRSPTARPTSPSVRRPSTRPPTAQRAPSSRPSAARSAPSRPSTARSAPSRSRPSTARRAPARKPGGG
jgi:hypothetical protein